MMSDQHEYLLKWRRPGKTRWQTVHAGKYESAGHVRGAFRRILEHVPDAEFTLHMRPVGGWVQPISGWFAHPRFVQTDPPKRPGRPTG